MNGIYTWGTSIPVTLRSSFPPGSYKAYVYGYNGASLTSSFVSDNDGYSKPDTANFKYPTLTADFEVVNANQTISFAALGARTYGDPDFSVSATASSGLTVSFSASGNCTVSGTTVHITGAGSCTITASQVGDTNYNAAPDVPQTFATAKANLTVTANNATREYGDANPEFSASYSGFKNGENLGTSGVTGTPGLTTTATATSAVPGPYTIAAAAGTLSSANYSFTFVDGELTITKATLNVKADNDARVWRCQSNVHGNLHRIQERRSARYVRRNGKPEPGDYGSCNKRRGRIALHDRGGAGDSDSRKL